MRPRISVSRFVGPSAGLFVEMSRLAKSANLGSIKALIVCHLSKALINIRQNHMDNRHKQLSPSSSLT